MATEKAEQDEQTEKENDCPVDRRALKKALTAMLNMKVNRWRGRTAIELLAMAMIRHGLKGDVQMIKRIAAIVEGPVRRRTK